MFVFMYIVVTQTILSRLSLYLISICLLVWNSRVDDGVSHQPFCPRDVESNTRGHFSTFNTHIGKLI